MHSLVEEALIESQRAEAALEWRVFHQTATTNESPLVTRPILASAPREEP